MRKRIIDELPLEKASTAEKGWLDLETAAQVEVTSECEGYPIEAALIPGRQTGWRANEPGIQKIRLLFDTPQYLSRIRLLFEEFEAQRGQEFVLRWATTADGALKEIVRQQYHFSPPGTTQEAEDYNVELEGLVVLELAINPDASGGPALAKLSELRLATR